MNGTKDIVKSIFKNDKGEPFMITDGQVEIFEAISKKIHPRVHIMTPTRYGKSETISMAVLSRIATWPEKWAIVAGTEDKAAIIMGNIIKHIFDHEYFRAKFILQPGESEESIRRYRKKDKINFDLGNKTYGEVFIATSKNAMGLGAPNVVEDESALINEKEHALVMRMLGDQPDNFLCKVGNPWESEHFRSSYEDKNYHKIEIDYSQAVREGRLTPAFIDEMRKQPFFDVLYEVKFPKSGLVDDKNWVPLLTRDEIDRAMIDNGNGFGIKRLGTDVAGGGRNYSLIVKRRQNYAKIIHKTKDPDTMNLVEKIINEKKQDAIPKNNISIDKVGIGRGVYDLLNRELPGVRGINAGEKPTSEEAQERYINIRAEMFWKAREWVIGGGKLERDDSWYELARVKYRTKLEGSKGKMQIMSKEEMLKEGIESPDTADAFAMTFVGEDVIKPDREDIKGEEERNETEEKFDPFNLFPDV